MDVPHLPKIIYRTPEKSEKLLSYNVVAVLESATHVRQFCNGCGTHFKAV